jgi:DNA-binding NarL/FixJ family response regulator
MTEAKKYKIILADDHIVLRDALGRLIEDFDQCSVVGKAADGSELQQLLTGGLRADLVILDLNMPGMDGYDTAKWLKQHHPEVKILVLTMYDSEVALIRLLQEGVRGFLKKDVLPEELNRAIVAVTEQGYYYSACSQNKFSISLIRTIERQGSIQNVLLTPSEIDFLRLAATDLTYKEIAHQLKLTPRTIEHRRDSLFLKLDVKSKVGLAIYAIKNGLVSFG